MTLGDEGGTQAERRKRQWLALAVPVAFLVWAIIDAILD